MSEKKSFLALFRESFFGSLSVVLMGFFFTLLPVWAAIIAWKDANNATYVLGCMSLAVIVAFGAAVFHGREVWSIERAARNDAESRLTELQRILQRDVPSFVGFIDWMVVAELNETQCRMWIAISVTNSGASSILQRWRIRLIPEDETGHEVEPITVSADTVLTIEGDPAVQIKGSDFIHHKTFPSPIGRGEGRRGLLLALIPRDLKRNWRVVVLFEDVYGTAWETKPYQPAARPTAENLERLTGWADLNIRHPPRSGSSE